MKMYEESKKELLAAKELNAPYTNIDEILSSLESLTAK